MAGRTRYTDAVNVLKQKLAQYTTANALPFGLLFLLQALVYNCYLHPFTVLQLAGRLVGIFEAARKAGSTQPPISVDAFKRLFQWINYPVPHADPSKFDVETILQRLDAWEKEVAEWKLRSGLFDDTPNLTRIFRAVVTPSRITLHGPELEAKNRILRKFPDHTDYFLRVQFCDEDGRDLFFSPKVSLEYLYNRFKRVLGNGIGVAGRVYSFL
ncbi:hypothetical protein VTK56DRAFT_3461 [Thermocarpiscus australiensis]